MLLPRAGPEGAAQASADGQTELRRYINGVNAAIWVNQGVLYAD
jgi:hypothetical protein